MEKIIIDNFKNIEVKIFDKDSDFRKVKDCKFLIIAVPISSFEKAILEIKDSINPRTLVIDVCSVKMHPVRIMNELLPTSTEIIATHPMFGPDSVKMGLKGRKIVICKIRCTSNKFNKIKNSLISIGLNVIEMSPIEHDKIVAISQVFTHLIGRIADSMNIESTSIDTETFKKLLNIKKIVTNDSFDLFLDMNKFNSFTKPMRDEVKKELNKLEWTLKKEDLTI